MMFAGQGAALSRFRGGPFRMAVLGDSIAAGGGATNGPVSPAGALFNWNTSTHVMDSITTGDICPGFPTRGSFYKQMANDYFAASGQAVRIFNGGVPGSYLAGTTSAWNSAGDLWVPWLAEANLMKAAENAQFDLILICCGVNDANLGTAALTVRTAIDNVLTLVTTNFPGVPIGIVQCGIQATGSVLNNVEMHNIRAKWKERMSAINEVFFIGNLCGLYQSGATDVYYRADRIHPSQDGNNLIGSGLARYALKRRLGYSKYAMSFIASCLTSSPGVEIPSSYLNVLATLANTLAADGNFFPLNSLGLGVNWGQLNTVQDFGFNTAIGNVGGGTAAPAFTQYQGLTFDGVNDGIVGARTEQFNGQNGSATDFSFFAMCHTNSTANPSNAGFFGRKTLTGGTQPIVAVRQRSAGNVDYYSQDHTVSNGTFARIPVDTLVEVMRNGTTKALRLDGIVDNSVVQTFDSTFGGIMYYGCYQDVSTYTEGFSGVIDVYGEAMYTGFDAAKFATAVKTYCTACRAL